jgi:hypothetical protein
MRARRSLGTRAIRTRKPLRMLPVLMISVVALVLGVVAPELWAKDEVTLTDAKVFIEFNATAQDAGIQIFLDGEQWKKLKIVSPAGRKIFVVQGKGSVKRLGLTELHFESEEPSLDELPIEELFALFPEGQYRFAGRTIEGDKVTGTATFTHDIPDGPVVVSPAVGAMVNRDDTVITWNEVTTPAGIEIVGYQVTVVQEQPVPVREFVVDLPADATSVKVPPEFLQAGGHYFLEVLAIEAGGNQTITEGSFETNR